MQHVVRGMILHNERDKSQFTHHLDVLTTLCDTWTSWSFRLLSPEPKVLEPWVTCINNIRHYQQ